MGQWQKIKKPLHPSLPCDHRGNGSRENIDDVCCNQMVREQPSGAFRSLEARRAALWAFLAQVLSDSVEAPNQCWFRSGRKRGRRISKASTMSRKLVMRVVQVYLSGRKGLHLESGQQKFADQLAYQSRPVAQQQESGQVSSGSHCWPRQAVEIAPQSRMREHPTQRSA